MNSRRTRITALLVLAVLACAPGVLFAECGACHPCCRPDTVLTIGAASCCPALQAARPEEAEAPRAIVPPAPAVLAATAPVELPGEPVAELAPEPLPGPPLLHEEIGLYTLHAAFLI